MRSVLRHGAVTVLGLFILIGLPFFSSDYFKRLRNGEDAVSGATVALDKPSGEYVVFINRDLHTDSKNLSIWEGFFARGEDEGIYNVFEDLSCTVADSDPSGLEMARSFQSLLPENQMKVRTENIVLMLSKAENGRFDLIIMSRELAEVYKADRIAEQTGALMLTVSQEQEEQK
ncbi:MAG: hypothetical protein IJ806_00530 [Ruminococcus sp.]|nr:hypothetical protein [Ruminococcus sp.]